MLSHITKYKIAGKCNYWKYDSVWKCVHMLIYTDSCHFFYFSPSDRASASLFLRWSLFLLPAPLRCSPPTAFNKTFFPFLRILPSPSVFHVLKLSTKKKFGPRWAWITGTEHSLHASVTLLQDVCRSPQIPVRVTLTSCFQGGVDTIISETMR